MTKTQLEREALQLSVEERLEIAEAIWESVENSQEQPLLPDWQRRTLDERIAEEESDGDEGSPWEEVKQRILAIL